MPGDIQHHQDQNPGVQSLHNFRGHHSFRLQCEWQPQRLCSVVALPSTNLSPLPSGNEEKGEIQVGWGVLATVSPEAGPGLTLAMVDLIWKPEAPQAGWARAGSVSEHEGVGEPVHVHPCADFSMSPPRPGFHGGSSKVFLSSP